MWELIQSIINMLLLLVIKILKRTIKLFKNANSRYGGFIYFYSLKFITSCYIFLEGGRRRDHRVGGERKWDELAETRVRSSHNKYNNNTNVISYNTEMAIYKNI